MRTHCSTSDGHDRVTCRLRSALIEPFYSIRATEMKKMHREDRERANGIATEGVRRILSEFGTPAPLRMRLLVGAKEFFAQEDRPTSVDGKVPLVQVVAKGE